MAKNRTKLSKMSHTHVAILSKSPTITPCFKYKMESNIRAVLADAVDHLLGTHLSARFDPRFVPRPLPSFLSNEQRGKSLGTQLLS